MFESLFSKCGLGKENGANFPCLGRAWCVLQLLWWWLKAWEAFLLSLWSFSMFCKKFCELFPALTTTLLTQSLKQVDPKPPKVLEVVYSLATNDFHIHEQAWKLWLLTPWLHGCDYHWVNFASPSLEHFDVVASLSGKNNLGTRMLVIYGNLWHGMHLWSSSMPTIFIIKQFQHKGFVDVFF